MAAQNLACQHARQNDIVGKLRLAGALCPRIDLAKGFADYVKFLLAVLCHYEYWPRINADRR
jgi:hypothetical protein